MGHSFRFAPTLLVAALAAGYASAVTVTVNPYDSGTLRNRTPSMVFVGPILASMDDNVDDGRYRNYFKFDLSAVTGTVLSAYLSLEFPAGAYDSKEEAELFELGDGLGYGRRRYTAADEGNTTRVNLNDDAIEAINAAIASGGEFVMGGKLSPKFHPDFGAAAAVDSDYIFLETGAAETDLCVAASFPTTRALVLDLGP